MAFPLLKEQLPLALDAAAIAPAAPAQHCSRVSLLGWVWWQWLLIAQLSQWAFNCFSSVKHFSSPRSQHMLYFLQRHALNTSVIMNPGFISRTILVWISKWLTYLIMSHLVFGFTSIIMFLLSNQLLQVSFCVICLSVPPLSISWGSREELSPGSPPDHWSTLYLFLKCVSFPQSHRGLCLFSSPQSSSLCLFGLIPPS